MWIKRTIFTSLAVAASAAAGLAQPAGFLGIRAQKGDTFEQCAVIGLLAPDGPGERAGLAPGDVITSINGVPVDCAGVQKGVPIIPGLKAGDRVVFAVSRAGKDLAIPVVADPLPVENAPEPGNQARLESGHRVFQKLVGTQEVFTFMAVEGGGFKLSGGKLTDQELADLHDYFEQGPDARVLTREIRSSRQDMFLRRDQARGHIQFELVKPPAAAAKTKP